MQTIQELLEACNGNERATYALAAIIAQHAIPADVATADQRDMIADLWTIAVSCGFIDC
jgi:hypothetical protein